MVPVYGNRDFNSVGTKTIIDAYKTRYTFVILVYNAAIINLFSLVYFAWELHVPVGGHLLQCTLQIEHALSNKTDFPTMIPCEINAVERHDDRILVIQPHQIVL